MSESLQPSRKILIVEDDFIAAEDLKESLEAEGYEVVGIAAEANMGLQIAEATRPDLVCMDIVLRGTGTGLELAQTLRERFDLASVFMTAYFDHDSLEHAKKSKPAGYLVKPIQPNLLRCTMEVALAKVDADRQIAAQNRDLRREVESTVESLSRTQRELFQAQKLEAVGRLTGGVAHDFNNLLQPILGYAELLSRGLQEQPDLLHAAEQIRIAALNARSITTQLLAFSRRNLLEPEACELGELIHTSFDILSSGIGDSTHLHLDLLEEPIHGLFDRNQIPVLLLNLCLNAAHASEPGTTITIRARKGCNLAELPPVPLPSWAIGWLHLEVIDQGHGISTDDLNRIFEPFFSTKGNDGTGLGLSAVHGIVEHHGGYLSVASKLGQGTTFTMHFPQLENPEATGANEQIVAVEPNKESDGAGRRILLIEDQDLVVQFVERALLGEGYIVEIATNLAEAQNHLESAGEFSLILADCALPDGHILDFLDKMEDRQPLPPIIFSSGYAGGEEMDAALRERNSPLLLKPYEISQLLELVAAHLPGISESPDPKP